MNQTDKKSDKSRHILITLLILAIGAVIIGILAKGLKLNPESSSSALVGKKAHQFEATWLQGQELINQETSKESFTLNDLKGQALILNFWASWCVSCRSEAQLMEQFWREHKNEGLMMVGIAIQDTPEAAGEFARYYGKTYPLGLDQEGKSAIEYGVTGVPETFFIDRDGIIRHREAGPVDRRTLEKMLPVITGQVSTGAGNVP